MMVSEFPEACSAIRLIFKKGCIESLLLPSKFIIDSTERVKALQLRAAYSYAVVVFKCFQEKLFYL